MNKTPIPIEELAASEAATAKADPRQEKLLKLLAEEVANIFQICASGAAVQASHPATIRLTQTGLFVWTFDQLECGNVGAFQPRL